MCKSLRPQTFVSKHELFPSLSSLLSRKLPRKLRSVTSFVCFVGESPL
jgi:hypothetical protein